MSIAEVFTGSSLVLVSWIVSVLMVFALGSPLGCIGALSRNDSFRRSLWWGLAILITVVLLLSLGFSLGSPSVPLALFALAASGGVLGFVGWKRLPRVSERSTPLMWWSSAALGAALVFLALAALGPVTNYDSGLYHLGAIRYQTEFGLVPGISNLYFPLGYSNSLTSLGAFLGSSPWELNGYRLVNGALLTLLALETLTRIRTREWSPGTMLLLGSLVFVWVPLVALSDYWVTSPTSDSAVLILTTVSVAYLADGLWKSIDKQSGTPDLFIALTTSLVLVSMRPTMIIFGVVLGLTVFAVLLRRTRRPVSGSTPGSSVGVVLGASVVTLGGLVALAQILRDRILSGWLQYPLSIYSFDVPWRSDDPVWFRTATLGAARDPEDLWNAAETWDWIPGWIERSLSQWETVMVLVLIIASTVLTTLARARKCPPRMPLLLAAMMPSAVAVIAWFLVSPPYFRFIWGPLFTLCALPGVWAASRIMASASPSRKDWLKFSSLSGGIALSLVAVVAFTAAFRWDSASMTQRSTFTIGPLAVPYVVTPVVEAEIADVTLASGLKVMSPVTSDQCWDRYPLCTPLVNQSVTKAGTRISDGFLP